MIRVARKHRRDRAGARVPGFAMRALFIAAPLVGSLVAARAETPADLEKKLHSFETTARAIADKLPETPVAGTLAPQGGQARQLVNAQIAFRNGSFDDAALALFEIVGKGKSAEYDAALFYLAESLFHKGDKSTARTYFTQLTTEVGASSKYYQQALIRQVELAIEFNDTDLAQKALLEIERGQRGPMATYVRGKFEYAQGRYDDALRTFADIARDNVTGGQALYMTGVVLVAKKELVKATDAFIEVTKRKPANNADRRVSELAHLALGRLFYERDQPSKSVDWYLAVDRRSDLFADALFEAAWVYVKTKQYDKALSALELLAAQDPMAVKTPTVKILEGNLRVRKAQLLRQALLNGLEASGDPSEEYLRAETLFSETRDQYAPSFLELRRILDTNSDGAAYMAQVSGRDNSSGTASTAATAIPEVAVAWLREEPAVAQVVAIENDLADMQYNIADAERNVERLQALLLNPHGANAYPQLAVRRNRAIETAEQLNKLRAALADEMHSAVMTTAETESAKAARMALAAQWSALPNGELTFGERMAKAQGDFDALEQTLSEVETVLDETAAGTAALRVYGKQLINLEEAKTVTALTDDPAAEAKAKAEAEAKAKAEAEAKAKAEAEAKAKAKNKGKTKGKGKGAAVEPVAPPAPPAEPPPPPPPPMDPAVASQLAQISTALAELDPEVLAMRTEFLDVRRKLELGRDAAGVADENALAANALRMQWRQAADAEFRALAAASPRDAARVRKLAALADKAAQTAAFLDETIAQIDKKVDVALVDVRAQLATESTELAAAKAEYAAVESESRAIGAGVMLQGFAAVREKLYDIVVRSDVGNIDVKWSQKEDIDADLKRFGLERSREVKQIRDEFRDILDQVAPPVNAPTPAAPTEGTAPGSGGNEAPAGGTTSAPAANGASPTAAPAANVAAPAAAAGTPAAGGQR